MIFGQNVSKIVQTLINMTLIKTKVRGHKMTAIPNAFFLLKNSVF